MSVTEPSGRTTHCSSTVPWILARIASEVYCGFTSRRIRGERDAVAGPIDAAAGSAARPGPRPEPVPGPMPLPVPVPAPPPLPDPCDKRRRAGGAFDHAGQRSSTPPASSPECSAARRDSARSSLLAAAPSVGGFSTGTVILSLPGNSAFAAAPSSGCRHRRRRPGSGLAQPDDLVVRTVGQHGAASDGRKSAR